jgi:hypothetical protein
VAILNPEQIVAFYAFWGGFLCLVGNTYDNRFRLGILAFEFFAADYTP